MGFSAFSYCDSNALKSTLRSRLKSRPFYVAHRVVLRCVFFRQRFIAEDDIGRSGHNQPPPNPARRKPLAMYGHFRINRHNKPVR